MKDVEIVCPKCRSLELMPDDNFCSWCGASVDQKLLDAPKTLPEGAD